MSDRIVYTNYFVYRRDGQLSSLTLTSRHLYAVNSVSIQNRRNSISKFLKGMSALR